MLMGRLCFEGSSRIYVLSVGGILLYTRLVSGGLVGRANSLFYRGGDAEAW